MNRSSRIQVLVPALVLGLALAGCGKDSPGGDAGGNDAAGNDAGTEIDQGRDGPVASDGQAGPDATGTDSTTAQDSASGVGPCGFDPGVAFHSLGEVLQLESADKSTCVHVQRRDDSLPDMIYKAIPFTMLMMRVGHDGKVVTISDPDALVWESTHHNWNDHGEATSADTRFRLLFDLGLAQNYTLTAFDLAGGTRWGPVTLLPFGSK